ncbi:MAG: hypothetical protein HQL24_10190 [Candidatus Omnitrophica bacterium]|nr:hypothetical protein [Candidatus Omnitrophota bacterium]
MRRLFGIVGLALVLCGCTTLNGIRESQGMGEKRIFQYPYDRVYQACLSSFLQIGLQVTEQNKDAGYLVAASGMSFLSYGERIAVFVKKVNADTSEVEVVSKAMVKTNFFAHDWKYDIFQEIPLQLEKQ